MCEDVCDACCRRDTCPLRDASRKFAAKMLLLGGKRQILVPTREEWIGLNLLECDGELPNASVCRPR